MTRIPALLCAFALLSGCDVPPSPEAQFTETQTDPNGSCWATESLPAIYEQVPGEIQVVQAELAEDGTVIRPPIYRKTNVPRVVRPRSSLQFEAPCPPVLTPEFIASLQRALSARAYYSDTINGAWDQATRAAVRLYQSERGLNSDKLSLETARALGLVAVVLEEAQTE
ncbi:MAG: peptidoglycan-binding protein [Pelagimonas sp.]